MARRVNKPFLIILTVVIGLAFAGLMGAKYMQGRGSSGKHWKKGDELAALNTAEGYRGAVESYKRALQYDLGNVDGWVKFGDVLNELSRYDHEAAMHALKQWDQALERNPRHVGALTRVLDAYIQLTELDSRAENFNWMRDRARTLAQVQPENLRAEAYGHIGVIGAWLNGGAIPERDVESAVASLKELWPKKRDELEIIRYIALANLRMARNREAIGDMGAAKLYRDQTFAMYDEAMKDQPQNTGLAWQHFMFQVAAHEGKPEMTPEQKAVMEGHFEKVLAIAKPQDKDYVDIVVYQAMLAGQKGKFEDAVKILEDLYAARPNDQALRLHLASRYRINPATRTKALDLLAMPAGDDASFKGFKARKRLILEFQRLMDLTSVRIDLYPAAPESEKPALKTAMKESYDKAAAIISEEQAPHLLKIRGRMLLLEGGNKILEAIDVFQRAVVRLEQRGQRDHELLTELARLYARTRETGQRRNTLLKLLKDFPGDHFARRQVIEILINERKFDEANAHLDFLEKVNKDDPTIGRLRVWMTLAQQDKAKARELVDALPEKTPQEASFKADSYIRLNDVDAAVKILTRESNRELAEEKPSSLASSILLTKIALYQKRNEDAAKLADAALAKVPDNTEFRVMKLVATGKATPDQVQGILNEQIIATNDDPVDIAINKYYTLMAQRNVEDALKTLLDEDSKQQPKSPALAERIFVHHLETGKPDLAAPYLERLEKADWDQAGGNYYRARLLLAQRKDMAGALKAAQEVARRMPGLSRTWVVLGQAQEAAGQHESAVISFNKALEMQVDNPAALRGLVVCYINLGNMTQARRFVDQGLRRGGDPFFQTMDQALEELQGDPRKVAARREQDVQQNPSAANYKTLADNYGRTAIYLAKTDAKAAAEYRIKARDTLIDAISKHPDDRVLYQLLVGYWLEEKKPEEALKVAQSLLQREKWKEEPAAYMLMATLYASIEPPRLEDAEVTFLQAVEKSKGRSDNTNVRSELANYYLNTGQHRKALDVLTELVKNTGDALARQKLIQTYANVGQLAEAEKQIEIALAAAPKDPSMYCMLARVRRLQENFGGAEKAIAKALEIDGRHAFAFYERGLLKSTQGNVGAALADVISARELGMDSVEMRLTMASLYRRRGDVDAAASELDRALAVYPDRADIRLQLIELFLTQNRWNKVEELINDAKKIPQLAARPIWLKLESQMWLAQNNSRNALRAIQEAQKLNEASRQLDPDILQAYLQILLVEKEYDRILADSQRMMQLRDVPKWYWLHTMRAQAYKARNDAASVDKEVDAALSAVDTANDDDASAPAVNQAIQLVGSPATIQKLKDRANLRWQIELARVYASNRLWEDCVRTLDHLTGPAYEKLTPGQQLRALGMGSDLYAISGTFVPGAIDKAIRTCNRYVAELEARKRPSMEQLHALNNLANLVAEHPTQANPKEALVFSQRAYDLTVKSGRPIPAVADTHGWVKVLAGQVDEGITLLREAASARENVPVDVYYHLGEATLRKNRPEEALGYLEKAKSIVKENETKGLLVDHLLKGRIDASYERAKKLANPQAASNIR